MASTAYSGIYCLMLVVITGPESSGKTTLAQRCGAHLSCAVQPEIARDYLASNMAYTPKDLLNIAAQQSKAEQTLVARHDVVVADTDLQTICIWWQEKFGPLPEGLRLAYHKQSPRLYLLCRPDLTWVPDPLRENPHDRERLFTLYRADLEARGHPYQVIHGQGAVRSTQAFEYIQAARTLL